MAVGSCVTRNAAAQNPAARAPPRHPGDDPELLVILEPEIGVVRADDGKELGHHGCDPVEVPGPGFSAQPLGDLRDVDGGDRSFRVHLLGSGGEQDIGTDLAAQDRVLFEVPGVGFEILAGSELGRVDEDAHHQGVVVLAGFPHQAEVTFVEVAHGGHETDAVPFVPHPPGLFVHLFYRGYYLHLIYSDRL